MANRIPINRGVIYQTQQGQGGWSRNVLIGAAIVLSIAAGAMALVMPTDIAPLAIGALVLGIVVLVIWLQRPSWAVYATLLIIFLPNGLITDQMQSNLNRVLTIVALAVWLFDTIRRHKRVHMGSTHIWMIAFILWCAVSLTWTTIYDESLTSVQVYIMRFILFLLLLTNIIHTEAELDRFMSVLAVIGWFMLLVATYSVLTTGYLPGSRLQVLDENANSLGVNALVALPGVLWKSWNPDKPRLSLKSLAVIAYLGLTLVVTLASGSRGSAISMALTVLVFLLFRQTRVWGLVFLAIGAAAAMIAPALFVTTIERFLYSGGTTGLGDRETLWAAGVRLIQDHFWLGVGVGNSPFAIIPYLRMIQSTLTRAFWPIHNPILAITADLGIFGIILYLGVLVTAALTFIRRWVLFRKLGLKTLSSYFVIIAAVFAGYMASWIKGGGMESDYSYFFIIGMLLIPAYLDLDTVESKPQEIVEEG